MTHEEWIKLHQGFNKVSGYYFDSAISLSRTQDGKLHPDYIVAMTASKVASVMVRAIEYYLDIPRSDQRPKDKLTDLENRIEALEKRLLLNL